MSVSEQDFDIASYFPSRFLASAVSAGRILNRSPTFVPLAHTNPASPERSLPGWRTSRAVAHEAPRSGVAVDILFGGMGVEERTQERTHTWVRPVQHVLCQIPRPDEVRRPDFLSGKTTPGYMPQCNAAVFTGASHSLIRSSSSFSKVIEQPAMSKEVT
jgi:hypothetical protein